VACFTKLRGGQQALAEGGSSRTSYIMQHGIITFLAQDYGQSPLPGRVEPPTHLFHRLRRNPSMGSQTNRFRSHCAMAVTGAACCLHGLAPPYRHGTGLVIPAVAYINAAVFCAGLYLVTYTGTVAPYTYMLGATRYGAKRARHTLTCSVGSYVTRGKTSSSHSFAQASRVASSFRSPL
jgi:hypothetical protein